MLQGSFFLLLLIFHIVMCKPECKDKVARYCEKVEKQCQNPRKMRMLKTICPKTCKFCGSEECIDAAPGLCIASKQMGECQNPTLYTRNFCKKTCNFCKPLCKDSMKDCQNIARMGLCEKLGNVKERCRQSCDLCA